MLKRGNRRTKQPVLKASMANCWAKSVSNANRVIAARNTITIDDLGGQKIIHVLESEQPHDVAYRCRVDVAFPISKYMKVNTFHHL